MTTSATTNDVTINTAAVLAELGLAPDASMHDVRRAAAQRVVAAHVTALVERTVIEIFRAVELPPADWSFDGAALPDNDRVATTIDAAEWHDFADVTARQLTDAALFEIWQCAPHLRRAVGLVAEAHRRAVSEYDAERGVA